MSNAPETFRSYTYGNSYSFIYYVAQDAGKVILMEVKLFENGNEICIVQVLAYNPPSRKRTRINQMGGGHAFVNGRVEPGTIRIQSPIPIDTNSSYAIEINQSVMRLELMDVSTQILLGQRLVYIGDGATF